MIRFLIALSLLATQLSAQSWSPREDDRLFEQSVLDAKLRGTTITFFDDGQSRYFNDDRYSYTYGNNGGTGYGYFVVKEDSSICVEFVTGSSRCDLFVTDAQGRLIVITETGDRFPVKP